MTGFVLKKLFEDIQSKMNYLTDFTQIEQFSCIITPYVIVYVYTGLPTTDENVKTT